MMLFNSVNQGLRVLYPAAVLSAALLSSATSSQSAAHLPLRLHYNLADFNFNPTNRSPASIPVQASCGTDDYFKFIKNRRAPKCPDDCDGHGQMLDTLDSKTIQPAQPGPSTASRENIVATTQLN